MGQWDSFDMQVVNQCSPVLLGIKMSNILIIERKNEKRLENLFHFGVNQLKVLYQNEKKMILLIYHEEELQAYLAQKKIMEFLHNIGYKKEELDYQLERLAIRVQENYKNKQEFPHEIGIFLGYPLTDVKCFIEKKGKEYKDCGYWKVYHNLEQAKEVFAYYDYAKVHMQNLIKNGVKLEWIIALYSQYDKEDNICYDAVG